MIDVSIAKKGNKQKKKGSLLPWVIGLAGIGGLWYLRKKQKEKELAQAQAYKDRLLPPVKEQITLPAETSASPDARLRGMGINTSVPGAYQTGENYKEI